MTSLLDGIVHLLIVVGVEEIPLLEVAHMRKPLGYPQMLETIQLDDKIFTKISYLTTQFCPQCSLRCAPRKFNLPRQVQQHNKRILGYNHTKQMA